MNVAHITVGAFEVNCFAMWEDPAHALVIDPGGDADNVAALIEKHALGVACYVLTHGHCDHVSAVAELTRRTPAPTGIHPADLAWAFGPMNQMPPFYPEPKRPDRLERAWTDGQHGNDGGLAWQIIETPGHTPGSVCLYLPDEHALVSGDTLFAGSVGRTDLPGGNSRDLTRSLGRLAELPDDTTVYPGHGPSTTIGEERRTNFFMQSAAKSAAHTS